MEPITLEKLHAYHSIDREIFSRLVVTFMRDPAESLLIMATWLWLEDKGYPNIIVKMMNLTDSLVNALAEEVALGLKCLETNFIPKLANGGMPLTAKMLGKNISLEIFYQNKFTAISEIKNFLNTICARIFTDILEVVLSSTSQATLGQPLVIPGFPHPLFGDITIVPKSQNSDLLTKGLWAWDPSNVVSEDDRTMFLTFSRGFPVTEEEVKELFTKMYGDCVVSVQMQENVPPNEQPLFARMILSSTAAVDHILGSRRIAKFRINGKHIWARKYERRD